MKQPVFYWSYLCLYISVLLFNLRLKKRKERWAPCLTHYFRSRKPTAHNPQLLNDRRGDFNRTKRLKKKKSSLTKRVSDGRNETPRPRQLAALSPRESDALCCLNNSFTTWSPGARPCSHSRFASTAQAVPSRINATNNGGWHTTLHFHLSTPAASWWRSPLFFSSLSVSYPSSSSSSTLQTRSPTPRPPGDCRTRTHDPSPQKNEGAQVEKTSRAQPRQEDEADGGRSAGFWL